MANVKLTAYHTCHLQESVKVAFNGSPYKSELNKPQWLGDGYYFWTDSDFFAHQWGRLSNKYPKGYVITQYDIQIPKNILLDLVGNVKDQLLFREQILQYANKLQGASLNVNDIPISKVLAHLRLLSQNDENKFAYQAIKAVDYSKNHKHSFPFLDGKKERLVIPSRQQLYLQTLCFLHTKTLHQAYKLQKTHTQNVTYEKLKVTNFEYRYKEQSND